MIDFPVADLFPEPRYYTDYPVMKSDNVLLSGDWEFPDTDPRIIKLKLALQHVNEIEDGIIGGDITAANAEAISGHADTFQEEGHNLPYHYEARTSARIIKNMTRFFKRLVAVTGNHDKMVARATKGQVDFQSYLDLVDFKMSRYSYMFIETSRGPYYVCHPSKGGGSNIYGVGNKIYRRTSYQGQKCHIVYFHTHLAGTVPSEDGLRWINAVGASRDMFRTKYVMLDPSNYPIWQQSVGMIRKGAFENIILGYTDLSRYLPDSLISWVMNPNVRKPALLA